MKQKLREPNRLAGYSYDGEEIYAGDLFVITNELGEEVSMPIRAQVFSNLEQLLQEPPPWCPLEMRIKLLRRGTGKTPVQVRFYEVPYRA